MMSVNNTDNAMSKPIIPITIAYLVGLIAGSAFNYFPITVVAAIIVFTIVEAILYEANPPITPIILHHPPLLKGD